MMHRRDALALLSGTAASAAPARSLNVAAASNLVGLAPSLADAFQKSTAIRTVFSFASTAQLSRQLEDGAPFDIFAAADTTHVAALVRKGVLLQAARRIYATGILALWFPALEGARRIEDLANPGIRTIALARPELAPYGAAAVEALRKAELWDKVQRRLVYASSVAMARQYGATGNADAVFVPMALVLRAKGSVLEVDQRLHSPLEQALGVVTASKSRESAMAFAGFLTAGKGHAILLANGYK